jgi:hypothetical protein
MLLPMFPLADEILLLIGEHVPQSQLATLCLVSRKFKSIFTPILHQEARLQKANFKSCLAFFERLSTQPNMVRRLYVGREIEVWQPFPKTFREDILEAIEGCLRNQRHLSAV